MIVRFTILFSITSVFIYYFLQRAQQYFEYKMYKMNVYIRHYHRKMCTETGV